MQIEIIQVGEIVSKPGRNGDYETVEIAYKRQGKVEGKKIVSFNYGEVFDLLKDAQSGEFYDITTKKNDQGFWDWTDAVQIDEITEKTTVPAKKTYAPKAAGSPGAAKQWVPDEVKQRLIVRQNALGNAVELLGHFGEAKTQKDAVEATLKLAEVFMMWVYEDMVKGPVASPVTLVAEDAPKKRGRPAKIEEVE